MKNQIIIRIELTEKMTSTQIAQKLNVITSVSDYIDKIVSHKNIGGSLSRDTKVFCSLLFSLSI